MLTTRCCCNIARNAHHGHWAVASCSPTLLFGPSSVARRAFPSLLTIRGQCRFSSNGSTTSSASSSSAESECVIDIRSTDLYKRLGVPRTATEAEIRAAYYRLVKTYHPDAAEGDKAKATEDFQHIKAAYEMLSSKNKRKFYDATGTTTEEFARRGGRVRVNIDRRVLLVLFVGSVGAVWYALRRAKQQTGVSQVSALVWFSFVILVLPFAPLQIATLFHYYCRDQARIKQLDDLNALSVVFLPGAGGTAKIHLSAADDRRSIEALAAYEVEVLTTPVEVQSTKARSDPAQSPSKVYDCANCTEISVVFPDKGMMRYTMRFLSKASKEEVLRRSFVVKRD